MRVNRRQFVRAASGALAVSSTSAFPWESAETKQWVPTSSKPKNVIVMICDDLGFGDLGCYGSKLNTPNLDRMAARGLRCVHYNAAHPICSASRSALLTGRYAERNGTPPMIAATADTGMDLNERTLGNLFHDSGYRTMAIGKWHLGYRRTEFLPIHRGFDSYFGVPYSVDMHPLPLLRDDVSIEANTDRALLTPRYTKAAVEFISSADQKPFFLYLAYSYPHEPPMASPRFKGTSGFGNYGDSVQEIDWSVGEILDALEREHKLSDTLVIFTSDHGPWFQGSPGLLRGRKMTTYEGGFRVPFLAQWPSGLAPGRVSDQWLSELDVVPTLTKLCDLKPSPNPLDGIDLSEFLLRDVAPQREKATLYFAVGGRDIQCARKGPWKLRVAQEAPDRVTYWLPHPELYKVDDDPAESYDIAESHPDIVADILQNMEAQMSSFPEPIVKAFAELRQNVAAPGPAAAPARPAKTGR